MPDDSFCPEDGEEIEENLGTCSEDSNFNQKFCDDESVKSGESKFKVLSFDPPLQKNYETEKCIEFWKFIQNSDLEKAKGFKIKSTCGFEKELVKNKTKIDAEKFSNDKTTNLEIGWKEAFLLLQKHGLDKVAISGGDKKPSRTCRLEDAALESPEVGVAQFLGELGNFDPEKKVMVSMETITDPILLKDSSAQTDFLLEEDVIKEKKARLHNEIDALVDRLAEMYSSNDDCLFENECICVYSNRCQEWDSGSNLLKNSVDKAICTCGEVTCLCSLLEKIFGKNKDCGFLEVQQIAEEMVGACHCSCGKLNCPCGILIKLHDEIQKILGKCDEGCTCKEECSCLSLFKKVLQSDSSRTLFTTSPSSKILDIQSKTHVSDQSMSNSSAGSRTSRRHFEILSFSKQSKQASDFSGTKMFIERVRTELIKSYPALKSSPSTKFYYDYEEETDFRKIKLTTNPEVIVEKLDSTQFQFQNLESPRVSIEQDFKNCFMDIKLDDFWKNDAKKNVVQLSGSAINVTESSKAFKKGGAYLKKYIYITESREIKNISNSKLEKCDSLKE